jgi:hypothetical protein
MTDKNKGGRPPVFETADDLWEAFEEYRASRVDLTKKVQDKKTKQVYEINYDKPLTLVGFCVYMGIHRDTLNDWKNHKPEFSDAIKKIYQECEADLVEKALLFENHADFAKHILNNAHGYTNKQEIDSTVKSDNVNHNIDYSILPNEALEEIAKAQGHDAIMAIVARYKKGV